MRNQKEELEDIHAKEQEKIKELRDEFENNYSNTELNSSWTGYQKSTFQKHGKTHKLRKFIAELNNDLRKKFNKNFEIRLKNAFCDDKFKTLQLEYLKIVNEEFKKISDNQIKKSE